jgi:2-methylcitrate dehydratase PrpD
MDGAAGIAQYSDAKAADPTVAALRRKTRAITDETLHSDEAAATIEAAGKRYEAHVPHASGTAANPMSDAAIEAKFRANATPVIAGERAQRVVEIAWTLERQPDVRGLIGLLA